MTTVANPLCRLAPRTSGQECAPSLQYSFITTLNSIAQRLHHRSHRHLNTGRHHHRRKKQPPKITHGDTKCYSISIIPIRITATAANACGFLLTCESKTPELRGSCLNSSPRRFRSRLTVIRLGVRSLEIRRDLYAHQVVLDGIADKFGTGIAPTIAMILYLWNPAVRVLMFRMSATSFICRPSTIS